jgi:hypothetical protein
MSIFHFYLFIFASSLNINLEKLPTVECEIKMSNFEEKKENFSKPYKIIKKITKNIFSD